MTIRGEFITVLESGDELVVPNQFTTFGIQAVLKAAFWGLRVDLWVGLCAHNPADYLALGAVQEPTIGVHGYQRQLIPMNQVNWPVLSNVNGESYIETREFTFPLAGAIDRGVNRFFITDGVQVIAISSAFESGLQYYATPITQKYRLYFR